MNKTTLVMLFCCTALGLTACNDDNQEQTTSTDKVTEPTLISFAKLPVATYAAGPDSGKAVSGANGIYPPFKGQPVQGFSAALKNEDITIYGDGMQTRTFCYIDDNVAACEKIFRENQYVNDVVNIGSDHECTILQLAETVIKVTGSKSQIVHLPPLPEGDMTRRRPDITKMKSVMQRPMTDLETGLNKIIEAWRKN